MNTSHLISLLLMKIWIPRFQLLQIVSYEHSIKHILLTFAYIYNEHKPGDGKFLSLSRSWQNRYANRLCQVYISMCLRISVVLHPQQHLIFFFFLLFLYLLNGYTSDYWLVFHYGYILYFPDGFSYLLVICIPSK